MEFLRGHVMQFLISDIHGDLKRFKCMLNTISFNDKSDKIIIIGDVVDRGAYSISLLKFIMNNADSMKLLMGNHELFMLKYLNNELNKNDWIRFGGENTLNELDRITSEEKKDLKKFLYQLEYYTEIDSKKYGKTIVTHTGVDADYYFYNNDGTINIKKSIDNAVKNNLYNYIIGTDIHYIPVSDKKSFDSFIIVGHVPCMKLNEDFSYKFYRTPYYMDIDSGAAYRKQGGKLGCYCVDTDEEFYL